MTPAPIQTLPLSASWQFHDDRSTLVLEPHARPAMPVSNDDQVVHLCFQAGTDELAKILAVFEIPSEAVRERHWAVIRQGVAVKVEQHSEFVSIMLRRSADDAEGKLGEFLRDLTTIEHVKTICLTRVLLHSPKSTGFKELTFGSRIMGGHICTDLEVRSTLFPDEHGFITFVVKAPAAPSEQLGRRIQRLLEVETYRNMCLLGLPLARRTGEKLRRFEMELGTIMSAMNSEAKELDDEAHFERLSTLMQEAHAETAGCRYRFAASLAYNEIVQQRLDSLEEEKLGELQTVTGFVRSRLNPGVSTIQSVVRRQQVLIDDLNQALSLLRTRIDLSLNRDNQFLLKSMDARHRQQVVIAQTVEGLSAVAISYYLVGLVSYMAASLTGVLPDWLSPAIIIGISVPVIFLGVYTFLHTMRKRWESDLLKKSSP
ncbi:DUF3422 domain-containing protein [Ahrensia sp. R2A130]|uniref:DUF3422 domain-containing protein n=1 Tax=Ahrensia sp. R2A130 TaxID=744979 RepID=UPI0001E0F83E|nr:DUF3422 domain-containing protein [Ahrensia sp. R2A130]EFL90486.1 conserved hypothetical protein [Ahrensia sp. R2A130]